MLMLKKIVSVILMVALLAFTPVGQGLSLEEGRILSKSKNITSQRAVLDGVSVGQLAAQVDSPKFAKTTAVNSNPQEIDARLLIKAGKALKNFRNNYYMAWFIQIGGLAFAILGGLSGNSTLISIGFVTYYGTLLVSNIWMALSFNSIGVAGERLIRAGRGY